MSILIIITFFLLTHWVADFVYQSSNMALNKSKSNYWLTMHVLTYSTITIISWLSLFLFGGVIPSWLDFGSAFIAIFALHWVTDYITSRMTSKLYAKGDTHNFFVVIGFDQILHYIQIYLVFRYIISEGIISNLLN